MVNYALKFHSRFQILVWKVLDQSFVFQHHWAISHLYLRNKNWMKLTQLRHIKWCFSNDICNSFIYRLVLNRVPTVVETDVVGDVATDDIIYRQGVITLVEGWKNGSVSTVHLFISKHVYISYIIDQSIVLFRKLFRIWEVY